MFRSVVLIGIIFQCIVCAVFGQNTNKSKEYSALIKGEWQSIDDSDWIRVFDAKYVYDYYQGQQDEEKMNYCFTDSCNGNYKRNGSFLMIDKSCFRIDFLDNNTMSLIFEERGNYINMKKVDRLLPYSPKGISIKIPSFNMTLTRHGDDMNSDAIDNFNYKWKHCSNEEKDSVAQIILENKDFFKHVITVNTDFLFGRAQGLISVYDDFGGFVYMDNYSGYLTDIIKRFNDSTFHILSLPEDTAFINTKEFPHSNKFDSLRINSLDITLIREGTEIKNYGQFEEKWRMLTELQKDDVFIKHKSFFIGIENIENFLGQADENYYVYMWGGNKPRALIIIESFKPKNEIALKDILYLKDTR